jgi:hypothetical protein
MARSTPRAWWIAVPLGLGVGLGVGFCLGCGPSTPASPAPPGHRDPDLSEAQLQALADLAAAADAAPDDFAARKASGMAHLRLTLAGVLRLRDRAEADLEAAFELDPTDAQLSRSLGRFYNLRAVAGDASKGAQQARVYAALLGETAPAQMSSVEFGAWSFSELGRILDLKNRGKMLGALSRIKELEATLEARVAASPHDVEMHALAGNFAFFFAGNVPFDKRERVERAVAHFEVLRARFDEMRAGARHPAHCPNTRDNFMFELAEGYLALGRVAQAQAIHRELSQVHEPYTRAKEQIAFVSAERVRNAERYAGDMDLMPPWPSDAGNCVVCHAWTADVPMASLHVVAPIDAEDIPRARAPVPIPWP